MYYQQRKRRALRYNNNGTVTVSAAPSTYISNQPHATSGMQPATYQPEPVMMTTMAQPVQPITYIQQPVSVQPTTYIQQQPVQQQTYSVQQQSVEAPPAYMTVE